MKGTGTGADWVILQPPAAGSFGAAEYIRFFGRAGLAIHDRAPALRPSNIGLAMTERFAQALGPFGQAAQAGA